jgi:hypothetical protein
MNSFEQCPLASILIEICEQHTKERYACDDVCAGLCLPLGLIIDILIMCPRYCIYKCCCNEDEKITTPVLKTITPTIITVAPVLKK